MSISEVSDFDFSQIMIGLFRQLGGAFVLQKVSSNVVLVSEKLLTVFAAAVTVEAFPSTCHLLWEAPQSSLVHISLLPDLEGSLFFSQPWRTGGAITEAETKPDALMILITGQITGLQWLHPIATHRGHAVPDVSFWLLHFCPKALLHFFFSMISHYGLIIGVIQLIAKKLKVRSNYTDSHRLAKVSAFLCGATPLMRQPPIIKGRPPQRGSSLPWLPPVLLSFLLLFFSPVFLFSSSPLSFLESSQPCSPLTSHLLLIWGGNRVERPSKDVFMFRESFRKMKLSTLIVFLCLGTFWMKCLWSEESGRLSLCVQIPVRTTPIPLASISTNSWSTHWKAIPGELSYRAFGWLFVVRQEPLICSIKTILKTSFRLFIWRIFWTIRHT